MTQKSMLNQDCKCNGRVKLELLEVEISRNGQPVPRCPCNFPI